MKIALLGMVGLALACLPATASAQWAFSGSPGGLSAVGEGVDCFPRKVYDKASHEAVTLSHNRRGCPGGYMRAENLDTGQTWRVEFGGDGSMSGVDEDGAKWRYNVRTRLFTNLATGRACASSTPRHVCPAPAAS